MEALSSKVLAVLVGVASSFNDYWTALLHPQFSRFYLIGLLPFLLYGVYLWGRRQIKIVHSSLTPHKGLTSWSTILVLAYGCLALAVIHLNVAAMGPQLTESTVQRTMQARDVCHFHDSSGSMSTKLEDDAKELKDAEAKAAEAEGDKKPDAKKEIMRIEGAQMAARFLIRNGMSDDPGNTDRFCLFRFDDDAYPMAPLTNDKRVLMLRTVHMTENVGGGTNFVAALGRMHSYFTTYSAENAVRVAIMTTDGYDSIDDVKRKELISLFVQAKIRLYIIGLGDGWKPGNTLDLQKFADELHKVDPKSGMVFPATNPGAMQKAIATIDALEKSQQIVESTPIYRDVDGIFVAAAIGFFILFFGLATVAGRTP